MAKAAKAKYRTGGNQLVLVQDDGGDGAAFYYAAPTPLGAQRKHKGTADEGDEKEKAFTTKATVIDPDEPVSIAFATGQNAARALLGYPHEDGALMGFQTDGFLESPVIITAPAASWAASLSGVGKIGAPA